MIWPNPRIPLADPLWPIIAQKLQAGKLAPYWGLANHDQPVTSSLCSASFSLETGCVVSLECRALCFTFRILSLKTISTNLSIAIPTILIRSRANHSHLTHLGYERLICSDFLLAMRVDIQAHSQLVTTWYAHIDHQNWWRLILIPRPWFKTQKWSWCWWFWGWRTVTEQSWRYWE